MEENYGAADGVFQKRRRGILIRNDSACTDYIVVIFHNDNFSPYLRHGFPLMFRKLFAVDALFTSRLWRAIQLRFNEKVACLSGESRVSVILVGEM